MSFEVFKGGKLAPKRHMMMPALGDFLDRAIAWPTVPAKGWEFAVPSSDMDILGNDQFGCCAEAGAMHLIQAQQANVGRRVVPTKADTLNLYTAVTGFKSDDPSTDNGTVLTDLLNYWQATGITLGNVVHKIAGYASVDISSVAQMRFAAYTFGGLYLGMNCPKQAEINVNNWNFDPTNLPIAGGHCIIQCGEGAAGGKIGTWGLWIPSSWRFLLGTLDEGYVVITEDFVDQNTGKSPTGLDLDGLLAQSRMFQASQRPN